MQRTTNYACGAETVRAVEVSAGDVVVITGSVQGLNARIMQVKTAVERPNGRDWLLSGPVLDLPVADSVAFTDATVEEVLIVGGGEGATVTRMAPPEQVDGFVSSLEQQWGTTLLYQIGGVDSVEKSTLAADLGTDLRELIPSDAPLIAGSPGALDALHQLPPGGWRVINRPTAGPHAPGDTTTVAAEHPDTAGAWLTASFTRDRDGKWLCHVYAVPFVPQPSKKARRDGLSLSWPPQTPVLEGSDSAELQLTITNTSLRRWVNIANDIDNSLAWLLDRDGRRIRGSGYHSSFSPLTYLRRLLPGEHATIANITLLTPALADLPPGDYGLEGRIQSLELTSSPGVLSIYAAGTAADGSRGISRT